MGGRECRAASQSRTSAWRIKELPSFGDIDEMFLRRTDLAFASLRNWMNFLDRSREAIFPRRANRPSNGWETVVLEICMAHHTVSILTASTKWRRLPRVLSSMVKTGGLSTFNIQHGFIEGLVRGYRSGFLDDVDYHHLTQCESIEGNGWMCAPLILILINWARC